VISIDNPDYIAVPEENMPNHHIKTLFDIYEYCQKTTPVTPNIKEKIQKYMNIWKDIPLGIREADVVLLKMTHGLIEMYQENCSVNESILETLQ
jgi:hypothetical protein